MGLFKVSLDDESKAMLREVIDLMKSLKQHEIVITLKEKDTPTVDTTFGRAADSTTTE